MARRPNWRAIKTHRNYTADEAARALGVAKVTVRRWIKDKGLPAITDRRPHLILGSDLIAYGKARKRPKQKCGPGELYCVRCRAPRTAAGGLAEFIPLTPLSGNLRAICAACETLMHRRVSLRQLPEWEAILDVTGTEAERRLTEGDAPCPNDHLHGDHENEPEASSRK